MANTKNPEEIREEEIKPEDIKPILLKDKNTGEEFTLEFDRDAVRFAEDRFNFDIDSVGKTTFTSTIMLFWFSFRMHHKSVSLEKAERILFDNLKGMPDGMLVRLIALYNKTCNTLIQTEENAKNATMTVEM